MSSMFEKFKQKALKPRNADDAAKLPVNPAEKVDAKRSDSAPILCTVFFDFRLREDPPEHR